MVFFLRGELCKNMEEANLNLKDGLKSFKDHKSIKRINREVGGFFSGWMDFLKEYSVLGMALGVIIAQASKDLVDSIVKGVFIPMIQLFISKDNFNGLDFYIKGVKFSIGNVLGTFLTFIIIMAFLYFVVKKIIKSDKLIEKMKNSK